MLRISMLAALGVVIASAGTPQYKIDTFAGTDATGDGQLAALSILVHPQAVVVDRNGTVYISDGGDHRIRKVGTDGIIRTIAGNGFPGYRGDGGPASKSQLNAPYGVALDLTGNLYVADLGNAVVRRVAPDGTISTFAGGGSVTPDPRGSVHAPVAKLLQPRDVAVDRLGNVYISDFGAHRVYQVQPTGSMIVFAGSGESGTPTENQPANTTKLRAPAGLVVDDFGTVYICDSGNHRIRRVVNGRISTLTDNNGKQLEFSTPTGVALDAAGRLYVGDASERVTVVAPNGEFSPIAVGGTSVSINGLAEVFTVRGNQVMRLSGANLDVFAGTKSGALIGDGKPRSEARFNLPCAIVRDAGGALYIADRGDSRIRRISPTGEISTMTVVPDVPVALALDSRGRLYAAGIAGRIYRIQSNGQPEVFARSTSEHPMQPSAIAFDSRDFLYVADYANNLIRRITPDGGVGVYAGGGVSDRDGPALLVAINSPMGLAFDSKGYLWFTEAMTGRLRKISMMGNIETLVSEGLGIPGAITIDPADNILIADLALHRISIIAPDGARTPIAGNGDRGFSGDGGDAISATFNNPAALLREPDGAILVVDSGNKRIRKLTPFEEPVVEPPVVEPPAMTLPPALHIAHSATRREEAVAPGQLVIITSEGTLPVGVTFTFDGMKAEQVAAAAGAISVQVPPSLTPGKSEVIALVADAVVGIGTVEIASNAPGILTVAGSSQAAAVNEDSTQNSQSNPATSGSVLALYLTGLPAAPTFVGAEIGGKVCTVLWLGPAPGLSGLYQMNVRTPAVSGVQPVVMSFDGVRTQTGVTVAIR